MYYNKFIQKLKNQLKKNSFVVVINHTNIDSKILFSNEFIDYSFVSLKKKSTLELLQKDPYKFFNLHDEKVIFTNIEIVPNFLDLVLKYSMSIYRLENYVIVSKIDFEMQHKSGIKMRLFACNPNESKTNYYLSEQILNPSQIANNFQKVKQQILTFFKNQSSIHKVDKIKSLVHLLALQIDQQVNFNSLAKELEVSQPTIQKWIELLEKSGIIYLLHSYPSDFDKRTIKAPKFYFCDLTFASHPLKIQNNENLILSPHFFRLVHNFYVMELIKKHELENRSKKCYYWKESNGHEVKFLIQNPTSVDIFEFTSSHEVVKTNHKELDYFDFITEGLVLSKTIVYDGYLEQVKNGVRLLPWRKIQ